jgi:hypothetical protein
MKFFSYIRNLTANFSYHKNFEKVDQLFDSLCSAPLRAKFFIEPPPDTQRAERQGERGM